MDLEVGRGVPPNCHTSVVLWLNSHRTARRVPALDRSLHRRGDLLSAYDEDRQNPGYLQGIARIGPDHRPEGVVWNVETNTDHDLSTNTIGTRNKRRCDVGQWFEVLVLFPRCRAVPCRIGRSFPESTEEGFREGRRCGDPRLPIGRRRRADAETLELTLDRGDLGFQAQERRPKATRRVTLVVLFVRDGFGAKVSTSSAMRRSLNLGDRAARACGQTSTTMPATAPISDTHAMGLTIGAQIGW